MSDPVPARRASPLGDARLRRFALLIELEKKARRAATRAELGFIIVNETYNLVRYRQAVLWEPDEGGGHVTAVSGLSVPDRNAPFAIWANRLIRTVATQGLTRPRKLSPREAPQELQADWAHLLPEHVLLVPLRSAAAGQIAVLLLARDQEWTTGEEVLLENLADAYGHAWYALRSATRWWDRLRARRRRVALVVAVGLVLLALVPVRHSAMAPAEVVAREPLVVRSSVEGAIDEVLVRPNEDVEAGQALVRLDDARLANQLELAQRARDVAVAELRQASQQAVFDRESQAMLEILRGRLAQHAAEVRYYESLLERSVIKAPRAGVAVFDNVNDLVGRPVNLGERVMLIADPSQVEVEIRVAAGDMIELPDDAPVRVFLNVAAHRPLSANLRYISYQAEQTPAGHLAYRLVAELDEAGRVPRLGLQGSAKVYGERTVLVAYVFRRPLSALRRWLGL